MALNRSTGYLTAILGPHSFESIFHNGCIEVRTGAQPESADEGATGDLVARITRDGAGWTPGAPTGGLQYTQLGRFVSKNQEHLWMLKGLSSGDAGWFRMLPNAGDPGGYSETAVRIDGAIGLPEAPGDFQMRLPTTSITPASDIPITQWWWESPLTFGA